MKKSKSEIFASRYMGPKNLSKSCIPTLAKMCPKNEQSKQKKIISNKNEENTRLG